MNGLFHVKELKTLGLREALSWIKQLGFELVIFETDSLQIVQALQNRDADFSEFGALIKDCLSLLQGEHYFYVTFTNRQNNVVAHILTRNAIRHTGFMVWNNPLLSFKPDYVLMLLIHNARFYLDVKKIYITMHFLRYSKLSH